MNYQRGMIALDGKVLSSEGWTIKDDQTGVITYLDNSGQPVGHDMPNAQYASELGMLGEGMAVATDEQGNALMNRDGNYILSNQPATGMYDDSVPSFSPTASPEPMAPAMPPQLPPPVPPANPRQQVQPTPAAPNMSSFGGGGTYGGQQPSFANGVQHPLWSGQPLIPGGQFNTGQESFRQNTYNPDTGAWAGNGASAAQPVKSRMYGGGAFSGGSDGGGGGGSALYQAWRDKLTAKLYPGSGSGYSGSSSSSSGSAYPPEENMSGPWAKKVDPSQAGTISYRPSMLIPKVAPGLSSVSPLYQDMAQEPAAQLGMIMDGTKRAKQPVYPTSHYNPTTGTSHTSKGSGGNIGSLTVNSIGNFYDDAINKEKYPTFDELQHNLATAGKHSFLGTQLGGTTPLGYAATNASNLYAAAFSTLPSDTAAAYGAETEGLIDQYGAKFMRKPIGKAPAMNKWIGRRQSF